MFNSPVILIFSVLLLGISIRLWIVRRRHKKAHELLSKTRDKLSVAEDIALKLRELTSALENTVDGIARLDARGFYVTVNKAHTAITGVKFEEIIGRPWHLNFHPDEIQNIAPYLEQVKTTGKAEFETRGVRKSGEVYWLRAIWRAVYDQRNEYLGFFSFLKDLTEQKEHEALIEEHRAKMLQSAKLSALGEMAGGVAHEINSPLTVISLSIDHLRDLVNDPKLDKESVERALDRIENTTFRIARIIKSLKTFCADGSAQPTTEILVRELIEDTLSFCSERFSNESVDLRVNEYPEVFIACRPVEISQVLLNLLNNAYDAVMTESDRWIKLEVEDKGNFVEISIADSGAGIPEEVQNRIMQPFFTTKPPGQGTGLGLSISRGIAESHQGELLLDKNSKHTRFILRLPKSVSVQQAA
jgi:PAS domain S-box-containing protein